jgi:hypothetical protein
MMRPCHLAIVLVVGWLAPAWAQPYQPAPVDIPNYSAEAMPCRIEHGTRVIVRCKGDLLEHKSLRELSILRNTIYARWGWDGYRKPWLRAYFHAQPWFKPNPKFNYKLLSEADKKNAHLIATREQAFTSNELEEMRDLLFARHGKIFGDTPEWHLKSGKTVRSCQEPKDVVDDEKGWGDEGQEITRDCQYAKEKWYRPDPKFSPSSLTADEKVELGLLARAMGEFALDGDTREKSESASLDRLLGVEELRQLSLRDLRLLRNTIYARRGRPFKSEILRDHFQGLAWYKVVPDYSDKLLSANDTRNIALIRSVENELGGPLSDEDWLTEPATDGA